MANLNMNNFKKNSTNICFSSLYIGRIRGGVLSLLELPSLEAEKRIDILPLSESLLKILHCSGFFRIRDLLDQLNSLSFREKLSQSDWECLRSEVKKRNIGQRTLLFENRKLLVLILTELATCSSSRVDSLTDDELMNLCHSLVGDVLSLSPSTYVSLVRWLENILQTVTSHLLVPWLHNRGGIGTVSEISNWMDLRSEEPKLSPALNELLIKGFMWDPFIWGPYLKAVKMKSFNRASWYVVDDEKISFLQALFELLNLCFYKRGQLYKFEYVLQLVQRKIAPERRDLRNILIRLFASIPGLRMVRTSECLLVEKTGVTGFFLDQ